MSDAWRSYPGAPRPGASLCLLDDIPDPGTKAIDLSGFSILLWRSGPEVLAYVNACPHQYLPLTHRAERVLSADGTKLICSNHDAVFDARTGAGLGGYGHGCELDPVPVTIGANGHISIKVL